MITIKQSGTFKKTENLLKRVINSNHSKILHRYGQEGVTALMLNTPLDTGTTARSWSYRIVNKKNTIGIEWFNDNVTAQGTPIAILLQYGHATKSGSYVYGVDFINPALAPVFRRLADEVWKEVIKE